MEDLMKELINAIEKTTQPTIVDILITVIPVIISLIAIIISIYIPYKEQKISLFNQRLSVIDACSTLLTTVKDTPENSSEIDSLKKYINTFSIFKMKNYCKPENNEDVIGFYMDLIFEANKVNYLFPKKISKPVAEFVDCYLYYVSDVFGGKDFNETKEKLKEKIDLLKKKDIPNKIEKYIKI